MRHLSPPSEWIVTLRSGESVRVWADSVEGLSGPDDLRDYSFECLMDVAAKEQSQVEVTGRAPQNPKRVVVLVARFPRDAVASVVSAPSADEPDGVRVSTSIRDTKSQARYREDARVLGRIGDHLARAQYEDVEVRLPAALADAAVAAWDWDDTDPLLTEDLDQRIQRRRAGTLALIGLSITQSGRREADEVVVALSPGLVGDAITAADDPSVD